MDISKPQFVTALYTGLEGTIFNGNSNGIYGRYCDSLKSLAMGGYSIICHVSKEQHAELKDFFADTPNVTLVISPLSDNPFHVQIGDIKALNRKYNEDSAWASRCVEIMWGKFLWLHRYLRLLKDEDSVFWIDAGIFHGGLVSNSYRSPQSTGFYDFDLITQARDLHADLERHAGDKILNILTTRVNHGPEDYSTVFGNRPEYSVIGGIFGGKKILLQKYIHSMLELMVLTLNKNILLKEEELMYYLHHLNPELYTNFKFNNWYHEDWPADLYNPETDISFSDFFKVIRE